MQAVLDFLGRSRRNYAIAVATLALLIAIAVAVATGLIGGGSPESFDAESFVAAANDKGAGIVLGDPLYSGQAETKVYGITFASPGAAAGQAAGESHGGASLTISKDSAAALQVYQQCEGAGNFICYRANNAALVFDEGAPHQQVAQVDAAIRAMASN